MNRVALKKIVFGCGLIGGLAALAVLFLFNPSTVPIYPVCQFHELTGLDCPGCGSLRAMHALLHGHLVAALHFNLFLVLSLPLYAWLGLRIVWHEFKGGPPLNIRPAWLWTYMALWLAFGILRDLPVPLFAAFAP